MKGVELRNHFTQTIPGLWLLNPGLTSLESLMILEVANSRIVVTSRGRFPSYSGQQWAVA